MLYTEHTFDLNLKYIVSSHVDFNKWLIESGGILQQVDQDQIHKDHTIMEW
jgi:hypothetical protein